MELKKGVYFVTGIDTDAGKSYVTGYLATEILKSGRSVMTQKLVQTGCVGVSEDIITHRRIMHIPLQPVDLNYTTCPVVYTYPCSPHMATEIDGCKLDFAAIKASTLTLSGLYETLLIEGAGGLMVPLEGHYLTADYVKDQGLGVIVVTSGRLGSINHTLLTLEVCRNRGIKVEALAYNHYPEGDARISVSTIEYLKGYIEKYHSDALFIEVPVMQKQL